MDTQTSPGTPSIREAAAALAAGGEAEEAPASPRLALVTLAVIVPAVMLAIFLLTLAARGTWALVRFAWGL